MRRCTFYPLLLGAIAGALFPARNLTCQDGSGLVLKVHSDLVLLDTTVLDTKGEPATGLQKDDFILLVDGVQTPIATFDPVNQTPLPETAQKADPVLDIHRAAQFGAAPLNIYLLDEVNTHFADASFARRTLQHYFASQPQTLRQAAALFVLTDHGLKLAQPFTADRDLLVKALAESRVENAWNLERSMSVGEGVADRLAVSLSALEQIAHAVRSIPVHKTLVWLGGGFPSVDPTTLTPSVKKILDADLESVTNLLLDARIALNAIDPASNAAGLTEVTDATQMAFLSAAGDSSSLLSDPFDKSFDFDRLAPVTGGRVLRGRNDVENLVDHAVRAGASFYSLGYIPGRAGQPSPGFHKIEIRLKRPGYTVLGRQGYYTVIPGDATESRERIEADLNSAVTSQMPMTDLRMTVAGGKGQYQLKVASDSLHWRPGAGNEFTANVEIVVAALSAKGVLLSHRLQSETAHARAGSDPEISPREVSFAINFEVPAGAATLRFVVRDAATGHIATSDFNPHL